jgi:hypothetical protein
MRTSQSSVNSTHASKNDRTIYEEFAKQVKGGQELIDKSLDRANGSNESNRCTGPPDDVIPAEERRTPVRRTESRKPVTTKLVDIGRPLNGSAGAGKRAT